MNDTKRAIEWMESMKKYLDDIYIPDTDKEMSDYVLSVLYEKQHNDELRQRLHAIYGDEVSIEQIVEGFISHIEEPGKPLRNAKILTYEDAEKWERWKQTEKQGRLVELPCAIGDPAYWISDEDENGNKALTVKRFNNPVMAIAIGQDGFYIRTDDELFDKVGGQYAYLTREDAQAALEKMLK